MGEAALRSKRRKILIIAGLIPVLSVVGVVVWVDRVADRQTGEMKRGLAELAAQVKAMDAEQAALREGDDPGNAWDDYLLLFQEIEKLRASNTISNLVVRNRLADRTAGEALVASYGTLPDLIVQGANRRSCVYPGTVRAHPPQLQYSHDGLGFCILTARALAQQGKMKEAVELLCAVSRYGRDCADTTTCNLFYSGLLSLDQGLSEIRELLSSPAMPREALDLLDRRLESLDRAFPRESRRELLATLFSITDANEPLPFSQRLRSWQYGFSDRILQATAFAHSAHFAKRRGALESLSWSASQNEERQMESELDRWFHSAFIWYGWMRGASGSGYTGRNVRAHLRLLRAAVRFRATGEFPDLEDPFGGPIHHEIKDGVIRLWSNGYNGRDDGGNGGWGSPDSPAGTDIVLEIQR